MVKKIKKMKKAQKQKQKQKVVVNVKVGGGKEKAQQPMFIPQQSQSIGIGDVMRLIESSQKSIQYMPPMKQEVPPTNITQLNNLRTVRMDDIVPTPAFGEPLKMESNVINQTFSLDNQLIPIKTSRGIATVQTETQPMETQTEQESLPSNVTEIPASVRIGGKQKGELTKDFYLEEIMKYTPDAVLAAQKKVFGKDNVPNSLTAKGKFSKTLVQGKPDTNMTLGKIKEILNLLRT